MSRGDHTHLPFGQGDMDMPAVLAALDEIAFTGLVCVECQRESPRAHHAIPEADRRLCGARRRVRICFVSPPLLSGDLGHVDLRRSTCCASWSRAGTT